MPYEPKPAAGTGAELFDPPALFYLTNQKLIEEWASLAKAVSEATSDWLRATLLEALARPCQEREMQVTYTKGPGSHRAVVAHPFNASFLNRKPLIGAGIAWQANVNPTKNSVFATVRCSAVSAGKRASRLFREAGAELLTTLPKGGSTDNFPIWRWVVAEHEWWTDLDGYRDQLVEEALRMIDDVREPLIAASYIEPAAGENEADDDMSEVDTE